MFDMELVKGKAKRGLLRLEVSLVVHDQGQLAMSICPAAYLVGSITLKGK